LYDNYNGLTGRSNFRSIVSNEIVYQLCRHLERYFDFHCTKADVLTRNIPKFNIDFLIHGGEINNLTMSHSYNLIFAPLRTAPKAPPFTQGGNGGGVGGGGASTSTSKKQAADRKAATAEAQSLPRNGSGCDAICKLAEDHRAKNDNKFPRLSNICTANNFATSKDMCTAIGLNASKCLMWGLYCSCKPERALEIMLKASKA
jgi:hypothetical protein